MKKHLSTLLCAVSLLSACGGSPTATLSVSKLSFDNQVVGTTSAGQSITLSNTGSAGLHIHGIAVAPPFSQSNTCGSSVAAGATCTINVTFTPTTEDDFSSNVSISDNARGSPQTIGLNGTGVAPPPSCSPPGGYCGPSLPCCSGTRPTACSISHKCFTL